MDVNEELKFLGKFTKKNWGGGGGVDNSEVKFLGKFPPKNGGGVCLGGSVGGSVRM